MALEKEIREATKESLSETYNRLQKIEELVKMGLMPIQTLPILKRAVTHMEQDMYLPYQERKIFYDFIGELMDIALGNPTINRLVKNQASLTKYEEVEHVAEAKKCAYCGEAMTGEGKYCCESCEQDAEKESKKQVKEELAQVDEVVMASKAPAKPMSSDLAAQVKADMEKRRAAKAAQMADAKKELNSASNKEMKKSYRKNAFKEEIEQVDEINKTTLNKYVDKATVNMSAAGFKGDAKKLQKRAAGIRLAVKKIKETVDVVSEEGLDLKRTPEGMLDSIANLTKTKVRAGGKISPEEKKLSSRAKSELRRRRDVLKKRKMREDVDYALRLQNALSKFGINNISELTAENKTAFFNYIENPQGE